MRSGTGKRRETRFALYLIRSFCRHSDGCHFSVFPWLIKGNGSEA